MDSFEELDLPPEIVEALAAEGMDAPTALQAEALPVLRKGHSALVRGGAGAGVLVAYGLPLLERTPPGAGRPSALVVTPERGAAVALARSLGRLALATGHRVAALDGAFALPGLADVLFAAPDDLVLAVRSGEVKAGEVEILVVDGAAALLDGEDRVTPLLELLDGAPTQGIVVAEPVTPPVARFVEAHLERAVHVPTDAAAPDGERGDAPLQRGTLEVLVVHEDASAELPPLVGRLLDGGARNVLLFFRNEDRAADFGDLLELHGFASGAPGEEPLPVWLATGARDVRRGLDASVGMDGLAVVSVDVPSDADELDLRHGGERGGVVLARGRELAHLRRIARAAGYALEPREKPEGGGRAAEALAARIATAIQEADLAPYHLLLEPALRRDPAAEVAAALAYLLRARAAPAAGPAAGVRAPGRATAGGGAPTAFVRVFLSVGSRDGIGPGDLLGAITGESGIRGDQVGRIDLRDTFSLVEISGEVAEQVIRALNGITIRGRSVRADYDRSPGGGERGAGGRGDRGPSPRGGPRGTGREGGGRPGGGRRGPGPTR